MVWIAIAITNPNEPPNAKLVNISKIKDTHRKTANINETADHRKTHAFCETHFPRVMPTRNRQPKTTKNPIRKSARFSMPKQLYARAHMPCLFDSGVARLTISDGDIY
jgi:hypothetical protein